ncbi:DUF3108 domain-containing protein [Chelativorans sp. AA-79]|uniref:DUF3108 domain-containing protein n=1 Tax=Chelativorans sp. AA-79 TaxID=3028735 RepID=UPI0023F748D5|nr:DUF3108 domain-containing protein [Chelativorans sp. AA-79]WEX10068.1 DUF3108 domain-containing protein [Chelativorans sp. AA-79]
MNDGKAAMASASQSTLLATALLLAAVSSAGAESYRTHYGASLFGLPVGRATFESRFEGNGFAIAGRFASAGIARLFERTDGTVAVNGVFAGGASHPARYELEYTEGKERQKTVIRFARGAVAETKNEPPLKKRGDDWVPLGREHLSGAADPISALLLPVSSSEEVCSRTIRVYDGEIRADIVLQPATERESFRGAAITCRARFVPVSGYRRNHSSITYLRDRARMFVGFEPVGGRDLYSPVEATIATKIGTVHIRARTM